MTKEIKSPPAMVQEFHRVFGHPADREPGIPTKEEGELRAALIREELNEFEHAVLTEDFTEACDALGDMLWVVLGGFEVFGVAGKVGEQIMNAIYESNMSKLCKSEEEAIDIVEETTTEEAGALYTYKALNDGRAVLYHAFGSKKGKIAKGPHYHTPDFSFLEIYE
jgi:predicted HAD superfamily Cof-like phosphohydrolase